MNQNKSLVVFQNQKIRRLWHNQQWYFSVVDVVGVLTGSSIPRRYWSDLKSKLEEEGFEMYDKIVQLKLPAADGKSFPSCRDSARRGGQIASHARKELEQETGKTVLSNENFLNLAEKKKRLEQKKELKSP